MWQLIVGELTRATQELAQDFARFLPRLLAMLVIAVLGWAIAYFLKIVVRGALRLAKFDKLSESAGANQLLTKAALPSSTELMARLVFWVVWVGFFLLGVEVLGVVGLQEYVSRFFLFLPRLLAGVFIVFFGLLAATFFYRAALLAAVNANLPSARVLAVSLRTVIVILAVSMAFEELGLADRTILVAFAIAFGALMLGLALAFGLGGQDLARRFLERRFLHDKQEQKQSITALRLPVLIDGKVRRSRSCGQCTTATILTHSGRARVGDRNFYGAGRCDCRARDRDRKLVRRHEGGTGLCGSVPVHRRLRGKIAAIHGQSECWAARGHARWCKLRNSRHRSRLRWSGGLRAITTCQPAGNQPGKQYC
jgi:hypothetical protein